MIHHHPEESRLRRMAAAFLPGQLLLLTPLLVMLLGARFCAVTMTAAVGVTLAATLVFAATWYDYDTTAFRLAAP